MTSSFNARVAAEVRAAMARQELGKRDLGRILGVSAPTAAGRWDGSRPYTVEEVGRIADALSLDVVQLLAPTVPTGDAA